jgi:predicted regulator of Ras-like GTPase activity (Roadblock/LC7/MglB family)
MRDVVERFRAARGYDGCVVVHRDGHLVAASWKHAKSDALAAFAPQMYKKVGRYVRQLDMGGIGSISFFIEDQPFTLVRSGEILFVAIHTPRRFSRKHVQIAQAVGAELGQRLKRIGR